LTLATEPLIRVQGLHYTYQAGTRAPIAALQGIDLSIDAGEYVAIVGANGSGKSTLLRHLNALLLPTQGDVWVGNWNTRDASSLRHIRSAVGLVFQVPDSQLVATTVEEDVAFGPENLGVSQRELPQRVDAALTAVGLMSHKGRASHLLSAGQKQRLAIAAILAMQPRCVLLDEATSLLDPVGKREILQTIQQLHRVGLTIVTATHNMAEAALAQRVIVLSEGRVVMQGAPRSLFAQRTALLALQLDVPAPTRLAALLAARHPGLPADALTASELVDVLSPHLCQAGR
jgi:energy-coupling factor transporter ATPase